LEVGSIPCAKATSKKSSDATTGTNAKMIMD
jgi:hypothetical protein